MPQALLIDSDILIDHLRKEQSALDYIRQKIDAGSPLFISVISRIEILSGARKGEDETIQSLFDILTSVNVDLAIADEAGEYLRKFRKSHALSIGDAVIAATAKEMGMNLVTRNIKHYPMRDVEIVKPY
ncbi:MAG: type II toxin-antitoxin system VapC family toxin [Syntrophales bacterium]|nr:type II toxin-antitoxin system VapC family toxin [Syntrophales bacterium]